MHHLIDVRDVNESYSAYDFVTEAEATSTDITLQSWQVTYYCRREQVSIYKVFHKGITWQGWRSKHRFLALAPYLIRDFWQNDLGIEIKEINRRRAIRALELHRFPENHVLRRYMIPFLIGLDDERSNDLSQLMHSR